MSIWFALLKKELRLGWMAFMIFLILQLLLMGLGIFLNLRFGSNSDVAPVVIGVMLTVFLLFYVPVYLLFNVIQERKTFHLWMQNPLPAWAMLLAKLSGALVYFIVTMVVVGSYTWVSLARLDDVPQELSLFGLAVFAIAILLWSGIGGGVGFLFLWTVQRTMRSRIGKWSWLVLIVGIGIYSYIDNKLTQFGIFDVLTNWGPVPASFFSHLLIPTGANTASQDFNSFWADLGTEPLYIGSIVLDLIVTAIFFLITAWLTDHELEAS
ncbi:hypothetical protein NIE88_07230 [Sporolactobacillus shoreicorticis]|uniref:ABC transporter permease n=1 Tax=Sporolactobacillus shoreicorticis TaxID=1923877 RepID=A0ABW5S6T0_9BACL|nr:hypothetical protein [Sporolactobacillus shoreicorticis]MCO7125562.1 hypothetical protein [Sporolactobacillus shoreicorticis]